MEQLVGKRPAWYSYNSSLLKGDGDEVCKINLKAMTEKGTMSVNGVVGDFEVVHKMGSGKWTLNNSEGSAVCVARKPKALRTKIILEELDSNGIVKARVRMQTKKSGFQSMYVYVVGVEKTDSEALEDVEGEEVAMKLGKKSMKKDWNIEKKKDLALSDVFLSFIYLMYVILYRRRTQESGLAASSAASAAAF